LPLLVDVHCRREVKPAAETADCLQIPAFLCRQTDLITEAGATGLVVNIKKGQFMSPGAMPLQGEKALRAGSGGVVFTERGTTFGYSDLVVDMRSIVIMKESGFPILFDVTHSQQSPPAGEKESGGSRKFVVPLAKAAVAAGADGIYAEVHPNPPKARSDRQTQLSFHEFEELVNAVR
ncbi:MAG: 3-deoxy-8-phosphooctulonate synthase, partial [Bacteroidales bacterium]